MGAGMTRRVVVSAFVCLAAALSGVGWAETAPNTRAVDRALALAQAPGWGIEAALKGRSEALTGGWTEQRLPNARVRLEPAVLVGLGVLVAAAVVTLTRRSPAPDSPLWCRWSVARRAPPPLRLS